MHASACISCSVQGVQLSDAPSCADQKKPGRHSASLMPASVQETEEAFATGLQGMHTVNLSGCRAEHDCRE